MSLAPKFAKASKHLSLLAEAAGPIGPEGIPSEFAKGKCIFVGCHNPVTTLLLDKRLAVRMCCDEHANSLHFARATKYIRLRDILQSKVGAAQLMIVNSVGEHSQSQDPEEFLLLPTPRLPTFNQLPPHEREVARELSKQILRNAKGGTSSAANMGQRRRKPTP